MRNVSWVLSAPTPSEVGDSELTVLGELYEISTLGCVLSNQNIATPCLDNDTDFNL